MMLREHDTPSRLMLFFPCDEDEDEDEKDDELAQRLCNREPSETEPAIFLTRADYDAAISWIFFNNSFGINTLRLSGLLTQT